MEWIKGRIDSLTVYIYKAETCTNILRYNTCMSSYPGDRNSLRYHTCRSSLPEDQKLPITELKWDARTVTDILGNNGGKLSHNGCTAGNFDLPDHGFLLLTRSTGPMEWYTGNSYQAEALTNVLRYHTCRSSLPEEQKLPITELKWDARTVTDILGNNAYWFFAFFWLTKSSRNKN